METSCVLTSSSVADWNDGHGRLYTDLFASEEHNDDYAILHIAGPQDLPHARPGFYFLTAADIGLAETSGLVVTDVVGDRFGFLLPGGPAPSLEAAACTQGNYPLNHDLPIEAWKTGAEDTSYIALNEILPILKVVAATEPVDHESVGEGVYCPSCAFVAGERPRIEESDIPHKAGCPIVLAQDILRRHGIVLSVYRVSHETWASWRAEPAWELVTSYQLAFSEEEIRAYLTADPLFKRRNIQIVLYRQIGSKAKMGMNTLQAE